MIGIQEMEQVLSLKYQQEKELEHLKSGAPTVFCDVRLAEQFSDGQFFYCAGKFILGLFILVHLGYHIVSTFHVLVYGLSWLYDTKERCCFYVNTQIY